jgi:hypothetical protein
VTAAFVTPSQSNTKVPARSNVDSADKAYLLESNKALEQKLREEIGDYWDSKDARNVFNPKEGEAVVAALDRRIGLLIQMQNDEELFLKHTNRAKDNPPTPQQYLTGVRKLFYLQKAYEYALECMPESTWEDCCTRAISVARWANIELTKSHRTVQAWHKYFSKNDMMMHPDQFG